jgi:succinoglycan biosynthesis protein ExoM
MLSELNSDIEKNSMTDAVNHISVCVCTYKRPNLLKRLLDELNCQQTEGLFTYSIVVADNDRTQSAEKVVTEFAARSSIYISYYVEPLQNIALARNKALANAQGNYIAFIDDDEYPVKNWLSALFQTCNEFGVDGVLGPVKPYFEEEPPKWVKKGKFFERPTHKTGYRIGLSEARTGNVMFRREILEREEEAFRSEFRTGGEDVDFFRRMMEKGSIFVWCNDAIVYEAVPSGRCTRRYLLRRALLRGGNSSRQQTGYLLKIIKSLIAVPVYGLTLPIFFVAGEHHFMKYMIKFCDHAGRILATMGLNPVKNRNL